MTRRALILVLTACCGGDHPKTPDAAIDAPPDAPANVTFQGELVDWDSSATDFCGVFMAKVQLHGATQMLTTPPNGRVRMDVPFGTGTDLVRFDVTPPTDASQCTTPASTYAVPGIITTQYAVIATGMPSSARLFTTDRQASLFQLIGGTFDSAKPQVFVHVVGTPGAVSINGTSATPIKFDGTAWAAGTTGQDVFFPNVVATGGTVSVMMSGTVVGTGSYPVEPGKITFVTLVAM